MSAQRPNSSILLIDFFIGISDGLVLPLAACIIAVPFVALPSFMPTAIGVAVALLGALVFGWARYAGEREEIRHKHPELGIKEAEEELVLLKNIGIDSGLREAMKIEMEEERALWLKEVEQHGLGWEADDRQRARRSGLFTGAGFLAGGIFVSLPFVMQGNGLLSLLIPFSWALCSSVVLGWARGLLTGRKPLGSAVHSGLRALAIIITASLIAWAISRLRQG